MRKLSIMFCVIFVICALSSFTTKAEADPLRILVGENISIEVPLSNHPSIAVPGNGGPSVIFTPGKKIPWNGLTITAANLGANPACFIEGTPSVLGHLDIYDSETHAVLAIIVVQ
jgi:hypothetical protein